MAAKLGLSSLKQEQKDAVMQFLSKKDIFVVLPTGFGKSICYGILPLVFDSLLNTEGSIVMVVSPLI